MNQQAKRIKELFGYARTLTKEQGIGTMCVRAAGFFKRRFFGKRARYWPSNMALEAQRSDPAAETFPIISIFRADWWSVWWFRCTIRRKTF